MNDTRTAAAKQCWGCFHAAHVAGRCLEVVGDPCPYGPSVEDAVEAVTDHVVAESVAGADRVVAEVALIHNSFVRIESRLAHDEAAGTSRAQWRAMVPDQAAGAYQDTIDDALTELHATVLMASGGMR